MNIKPLGSRVLLKTLQAEEKTAGGIYLPATAQEKTNEGLVVAVGDDEDIQVKVNDRVIYDKYAGTQLEIEKEEHILLGVDEILAVIQ